MTWINGGDCLETVREVGRGKEGERPGDWSMRGLTRKDSRAILRAKSKAKRCKLQTARLRERGGQRAGVRTGEGSTSFSDTPSHAARDSFLLPAPIATTKRGK